MIGFRIDEAKGLFFDRQKVLDATTKAERRNLSKQGAFVRTRARSLIRKRKRTSAPGQPPSSHTGLLKDFLFFVYEPQSRSVVIGPAKLNQQVGNAPEALEHGGPSESVTGPRARRKRRVINVRPRPYMAPALQAELTQSQLDSVWKNSVR